MLSTAISLHLRIYDKQLFCTLSGYHSPYSFRLPQTTATFCFSYHLWALLLLILHVSVMETYLLFSPGSSWLFRATILLFTIIKKQKWQLMKRIFGLDSQLVAGFFCCSFFAAQAWEGIKARLSTCLKSSQVAVHTLWSVCTPESLYQEKQWKIKRRKPVILFFQEKFKINWNGSQVEIHEKIALGWSDGRRKAMLPKGKRKCKIASARLQRMEIKTINSI